PRFRAFAAPGLPRKPLESRSRSGALMGQAHRSPEHVMSQTAERREHRPPSQLKDADFNWEDPLDLEGELTEEERMVSDTPRGYAQDKVFPRVLHAYREEKIDRDLIPEMGALGLLGPTIPEEYGGAGLGYVAYGLIAREIERVDSGYRSTLSVQSS